MEANMRNTFVKRLVIALVLTAAAVPSLPLISGTAVAGDNSGNTEHGERGGGKDNAGSHNVGMAGQ
jgi:hypothetical protein